MSRLYRHERYGKKVGVSVLLGSENRIRQKYKNRQKMYVKSKKSVQTLRKQHSSGEMRHGKKDRQPSPEPVTYALTRSFSHTSCRIGHAPSSHIAAYVTVTGVLNPRPLKTCYLEAGTCILNGSRPASLRWMVQLTLLSLVCSL